MAGTAGVAGVAGVALVVQDFPLVTSKRSPDPGTHPTSLKAGTAGTAGVTDDELECPPPPPLTWWLYTAVTTDDGLLASSHPIALSVVVFVMAIAELYTEPVEQLGVVPSVV